MFSGLIPTGDSLGHPLIAFQFTSPGEEILRLGSFRLKWYGVLIATAVLVGVNLSMRLAKSRNIDPEAIADLAIWLILGAIPAARLYYVAFEWQTYSQHPEQIIKIWEGGIAIHGAIIGGSIAATIFAKLKQLSFWQLADIVAPSVALGQTIGRWGNFFNSEAFGRPTEFPWKLYIPKDRRPFEYINSDYFHPTFLYESLWNLLVFIVLMWLFINDNRHHRLRTGSIFLVYLIAYSIGRFGVEGLRTDSLMFGSLRMAQVISLAGIAIGSIGLSWLYIRRRSLPDVV
ncbi:prolipoprotein diacylglyceryl transferase [Chamaesiphon sp.]|uniref:prolipoprotein diacylglyceryl transferase n=1 Tax=Chamaesiphon sp. TaxID=2814140 RepID=UPI003594874D